MLFVFKVKIVIVLLIKKNILIECIHIYIQIYI